MELETRYDGFIVPLPDRPRHVGHVSPTARLSLQFIDQLDV